MKTLQEIKQHLDATNLELSTQNRDDYGEVFTPSELIEQIITSSEFDKTLFTDPKKTVCDHGAGNGQFLSAVLYCKLENGIDFETALGTIFCVEINPENVKLCQDRLLCGREDLKHIVEQNIVCADALTYHYRFDGTAPDVTDKDLQLENLGFEFS